MLHLHETTRKRVGRVAFIALCAVPTLATAAWIAWRLLPGGDERASRRLGAMLHVAAAATEWREPRPGATRAATVAIRDESTLAPLGQVSRLEWRRRGDHCAASLESAIVRCDQLDHLANRLGAWLDALGKQSLHLGCRRVVLQARGTAADAGAFALVGVQVEVDRDAAGAVRLRMSGRAAKQSSNGNPLQLTVERAADADAGLQVAFDTGGAAVPVSILAGVVPGFGQLGDAATFAGVVGGRVDGPDFRGAASGRLVRVDLSAVLPTGSPHTIRGEANIHLAELHWHAGRLDKFAGRIDARNALISPSLTAAAAEYMRCPHERASLSSGLISGREALIAVDRLKCRFCLDGAGLLLEGDFAPEENFIAGCLATSGGRPLLLEPGGGPMPTGAWIQFLLGPSQSWLPATRQAVDIAEQLPLPAGTTLLR